MMPGHIVNAIGGARSRSHLPTAMLPTAMLPAAALCAALLGAPAQSSAAQQTGTAGQHDSVQVDPKARVVPHDRSVFGADPNYGDPKYDYQAQLDIYGGKHMNRTQRPLLELGRELYQSGPFSPAPTLLGSHNILIPQLLVYGDFRTAGGADGGAKNVGTWGNRLNLDIDFKITANERVHALLRPLEKDGQFTRFDFTGDTTGFKGKFNGVPAALFFEGDLGAIVGGLIGRDAPFDMPIAAGKMPLLFHNGIWIQDVFTGGAFTIPARNSGSADWSNFDISFFYGGSNVSNAGVGDGRDHGQLVGFNTFIEAYHGYVEAGYANVFGAASGGGRDFNSVALSFTRRYGGRVSNSVRYIGTIGQTTAASAPGAGGDANGHLFLIENSLISAHPLSVVPYLNLFVGIGSPVSAARDPGAGGILTNTGLNFEGDAITGFPSLNASAKDAAGGALGLELLGSGLDRQVVGEVAAAYPSKTSTTMPGGQYAAGVRVQQPLTNAMILRLDGMFGKRSGLTDIHGVRIELRYKF